MKKSKLIVFIAALFSLILSGCDFFNKLNPSVTLVDSEITLNIGNIHEKTYQINPYTNGVDEESITYVYQPEDNTIATCTTSGFVSAKSIGTTNINVSVKNRRDINKAVLKVNVINNTNPSISFKQDSYSIQIGKSLQLDPLLANISSSLLWSSSNNDVATVTNQGLVTISETASAGDSATITVSLSSDETVKATCNVVATQYLYDYTVMMYMSGSTLEYDPEEEKLSDKKVGLLTTDILEVLSTKNIPNEFKIVIQTGGTKEWQMSSSALEGATSISNKKLQRWEVIPSASSYQLTNPLGGRVICYNKLKLIESLSINNMATQNSFESFLKWGLSNYSATQMGVVISGHGGGIAGCSYDDNSFMGNDTLITSEIYKATGNALSYANRDKITWIGFDCCLMGCADIATSLSDFYEYMIASQESEPGEGWDHDVWMKTIIDDRNADPETVIDSIINSFVNYHHNIQDCGHSTYSDGTPYVCLATLAAYDLSKADTLISSFNALVDSIGTNSRAYRKFKSAFTANTTYNSFGEGDYGLADFNSFLDTLAAQQSIDVTEVKNAISEFVIKNRYCSYFTDNSFTLCGLNIFFPISTGQHNFQVSKSQYLNQYQTKLSAWQEMCVYNW